MNMRHGKDPYRAYLSEGSRNAAVMSRPQVFTNLFLVVSLLVGATIGALLFPFLSAYGASAVPVSSPFRYQFSVDGTLEESGSMAESSSPYWWLNSGGKMSLQDGVGTTVQGSLPVNDFWRKLYSATNSLDTGNGYVPQNIFRLVTRSSWRNARQQVYFRATHLNMTASPQRNGSNGVLLFNRYRDGNNLYYTGIRVDGAAVIKKKSGGVYSTLAYKPVFTSSSSYDVNQNPNLIPLNTWMGLRSTVKTLADGSVEIKVFLDRNASGQWQEIAAATDNGSIGGPALTNEGHGGVRTDFMDVVLDDFSIVNM
jgi:hypothetical protein